jgi:hypothetical protein
MTQHSADAVDLRSLHLVSRSSYLVRIPVSVVHVHDVQCNDCPCLSGGLPLDLWRQHNSANVDAAHGPLRTSHSGHRAVCVSLHPCACWRLCKWHMPLCPVSQSKLVYYKVATP